MVIGGGIVTVIQIKKGLINPQSITGGFDSLECSVRLCKAFLEKKSYLFPLFSELLPSGRQSQVKAYS